MHLYTLTSLDWHSPPFMHGIEEQAPDVEMDKNHQRKDLVHPHTKVEDTKYVFKELLCIESCVHYTSIYSTCSL